MEQKVRELRIEVDRMINSTCCLNPSREVSLCHTSLQRSKSWLGMVLKCMGTQTPYPASSDPGSTKIEPQAEHIEDSIFDPSHIEENVEETQTSRVKYFRKVIEGYLKKFQTMEKDFDCYTEAYQDMYLFKTESGLAMIEAKHWLGWELDRIRREKENIVTFVMNEKELPL